MNEQRLIDFGQLYDSISDNWCGLEVASVSDILNFIKDSTPIDPETLPIVKELKEKLNNAIEEKKYYGKCWKQMEDYTEEVFQQLDKVTAERDAAISDLYYACACETCELQYTDRCPLKKGMVPCSNIASALRNNTPYKWRGTQGVQDDE